MTHEPRILISGASIAGPTLAYWLVRNGFRPTVVERSPELRPGGNGVDIRADSVRIAERMGVLPRLRERATDIRELTFVDAADRRVAGMSTRTFNADGDLEIMRGDLAQVLYEATADDVEYAFGDSIAELIQRPDAVEVTFDSDRQAEFDLVLGADGLHSRTRNLAVTPEADALHHLGVYFATARVDAELGRPHSVTLYNTPGKVAGVYRSGTHDTATAFFAFRASRTLEVDHRDQNAQKDLLRDYFDDRDWQVPALLDQAVADDGFYFDAVSQVRIPAWSNGRVALVGDAGYCATLLSGAGAALAIEGAHLLATELAAAAGDHRIAFRRYERTLRPTVLRAQRSVRVSSAMLIPATGGHIRLRNQLTRLMVLQTLASRVYRPVTVRAA
ncbi:FAD-dependent monooxygenase [Nocardia sp. CY41]|uniref:FAD-dependent monooxygenase n=1 Tax=Nocardia sp. CY41 TaxID=2608686 RepID=UPI00135C6178|nr:FAD-dependent monooxygenase [Nocardia sp. CY41]